MENNRLKEILNDGGKIKINWVMIAFVILQLVFLVVVVFSVLRVDHKEAVLVDEVGFEEDDSQITIVGLSSEVPGLADSDVKVIQQKLFKVMGENNTELNTGEIKAKIREGTVSNQYFEDIKSSLLTMVVDVPELEQSYRIVYEYPNGILDLDESVFVLCLDEGDEVIYPDFHCKSSDSRITRFDVVVEYLPRYSFDNFTVSVANDSNRIVINPFNEGLMDGVKNEYINLVREKVKALGVSPDAFEYSLIEMDDMNYEIKYDDSE